MGFLLQDAEEAVGLFFVAGTCHVFILTFHLIFSSLIFQLALFPPRRVWGGVCFGGYEEKCREMQRDAEKCREMQINADRCR